METPPVVHANNWTRLLDMGRHIVVTTPRVFWLLFSVFLGCTFVGFLLGDVGPLSGNAVVNIGRIGLAFTFFHYGYYRSKRDLPKWNEYVYNGLAAGLLGICLGGFLYSLCLFTPEAAGCMTFEDPPLLLEKLGRFIFFGIPLIVGLSLLIGFFVDAILNNGISERLSNQVSFTLALAIGCFMIVWIISDSVRELGLVVDGIGGPELGDMDPLRHGLLALGLGVVGTVILGVISARNPGTKIHERIFALDAFLMLAYVYYIQTAFIPQTDILVSGTGVGVIIAWICAALSLVYLTTFLVGLFVPKKRSPVKVISPLRNTGLEIGEDTSPKVESSTNDYVKRQIPAENHKIFLSYRRDDSIDITGRMYDRLAQYFGEENVFRDFDDIPLGADFKKVIDDIVSRCEVIIVVIGRNWIFTEEGENRIQQPKDFVRIEVESALKRKIPVIPAFVGGAEMPAEEDLPKAMKPLVYRNGIDIRSDPDFHRDLDSLIGALEEILNDRS